MWDKTIFIFMVLMYCYDLNAMYGLFATRKLSWVYSEISQLNQKHVLPPKEPTTLYNSIAKPHLDYACEIWGRTNKTFLSPLEIMQKRIIQSIFNLQHRSHTTEYFYKANILKLHDQIFFNTCKYLYKKFHRNVPENIHHLFEINKKRLISQWNIHGHNEELRVSSSQDLVYGIV